MLRNMNRLSFRRRTGKRSSMLSAATHPVRQAGRRARFEQLEPRQLLAATPIEVLAAGLSGNEQMQLEIDGITVQTWDNIGGDFEGRVFESFNYTHPTDVTADRVRVRFTEGSGIENDLRVDGVRVGGLFFEAEAPNTFSTGTWDDASASCLPRFAQSEELHCLNGYFQFDAPTDSIIEIFAAGRTGTEIIALEIDGVEVVRFEDVAGNYDTRVFETLSYTHSERIGADQIRVVLVDGSNTPSGEDRNVRIDAVTVDGQRYETEAPSVFSNGSWRATDACAPGFKSSELLHCTGGFFEFPGEAGGSEIMIRAAGATGTEQIELRIDGAAVQTWDNVGGDYINRTFDTFRYTHSSVVSADRVSVAFTNDGSTPTGADRNLRVDDITLDGVVFEAEDASVFSTGTWDAATGCAPGFKQSESLHCNGEFRFNFQPQNPGVIGIGATQYNLTEPGGPAVVTFVRTDGSDGIATVDYTTVSATATAGQDFVPQTGTITFVDGETEQSVSIPIINDDQPEGTETFNLAIDRVTGASAGQPRTTTISIFDDEQPSAGSGNGLAGEYFGDTSLANSLFARTDLQVDFDWDVGSPAPSVPADNFSVRWTGEVQPLYSETYTFSATTDDGVRLWIDDQLIIDQFIVQPETTHTGQITLTAGQRYDVRMEYFEAAGVALARLGWSSPRQAEEIIPTSQLYSDPIVPTSGTFSGETIATGLTRPTAIEFAPTGQMFIAQQNGVVRLLENGQLMPSPFIDLSAEVNNIQDRGLLGLALHPDFLNQPYVYLLYTYDPPETIGNTGLAGPDGAGNRVARLLRVTADSTNGFRSVVPGSEVVLLGTNSTWEHISNPDQDGTNNVNLPPSCDGTDDCLPVDSRSHSVGALAFAPDGSLFVTNGDGTSFGRVDPRTVRVQSLDSLAGKVLRIDPLTGEGIADNPFFETTDPNSNRSKVYNYGLRNPFRMAIRPETGIPYVSDVGWNAWEEINGGVGQNFGWPFYEGGNGQNLRTGGYRDLPEAAAFYANNNAVPPLWSRSHAAGGVAVVLGDFYTGSVYPSEYQGTAFFTDFGDPTIRALPFNPDGSVQPPLLVNNGVGAVVEMTMGPDGLMYYVDLLGGNIGRLLFTATGAGAVQAGAVQTGAVQSSGALSQTMIVTPEFSSADFRPPLGLREFEETGAGAFDSALDLLLLESQPVAPDDAHSDERLAHARRPSSEHSASGWAVEVVDPLFETVDAWR